MTVGPRFTLKLRRVDKGIQRASGQEWEWKGKTDRIRTKFQLWSRQRRRGWLYGYAWTILRSRWTATSRLVWDVMYRGAEGCLVISGWPWYCWRRCCGIRQRLVNAAHISGTSHWKCGYTWKRPRGKHWHHQDHDGLMSNAEKRMDTRQQ